MDTSGYVQYLKFQQQSKVIISSAGDFVVCWHAAGWCVEVQGAHQVEEECMQAGAQPHRRQDAQPHPVGTPQKRALHAPHRLSHSYKTHSLYSFAKQVITYIDHSRPVIPDRVHLIFFNEVCEERR